MKTIKNKVLFLLFGLFLGSISVVAATIIESKDVSYIRSSSNVTNVQEEGSIPGKDATTLTITPLSSPVSNAFHVGSVKSKNKRMAIKISKYKGLRYFGRKVSFLMV